jgi:hypothetical protein
MSDTRSGLLNAALNLLVAAVSGVLGAVLYAHWRYVPPAPPPVAPPPRLVVLDMQQLIEPVMKDATLDDSGRRARVMEISNHASKTIDKYVADGIVVIDAAAVLRAPAGMYVKP